LKKQENKQTQILALSIDPHADSKKLIDRLKAREPGDYDFDFLEDRDHKVIDRYGLYNPDGRGWPHPATYIIDKQGVVRWKFIEVDYRKRPTNEQIQRELAKLQ
jgi:peroxiredoxin